MIFPSIAVLLSLLALLLLWRFARGESVTLSKTDDLAGRTRPVDIDAFRNLMDPREDEFLRVNLFPSEFRSVQRARLLAALDYVRSTAHNAAVLLRLGKPPCAVPIPGSQLPGSVLSIALSDYASTPF